MRLRDDDHVEVIVEIPKRSHNKYEIDHETGELWLDRVLSTATRYPVDYGFIVDTFGEDGDPLDAMVLLEDPAVPGCHVEARPIGMLDMEDEAGRDPKILCVAVADPMLGGLEDFREVPPHLLREIDHFFNVYKALQPGTSTETMGWSGAEAATATIASAREREAARRPEARRAQDAGLRDADRQDSA